MLDPLLYAALGVVDVLLMVHVARREFAPASAADEEEALYTDPNGLPIHGTMSAREAWDVDAVSTGGRVARLRAGFEYVGAELLAAFPFPHRLETAIDVVGRSLSVATTIRPSGDRGVPVSFGYHPYFRLPGGRRSAWRLLLPRRAHVELDKRGIPTGRSAAAPAEAEPIGARTYDDLFELTGERRLGIQHGGWRLSVLFGAGYPYAQVYAPPGRASPAWSR